MARVTVEDCIRKVPNRFELALMAATRSRQISSGQGQPLLVERDGDRDPVIALREIADGKITADEMKEKIIADMSRSFSMDGKTDSDNDQIAEGDEAGMSEEEMLENLNALKADTDESRNLIDNQLKEAAAEKEISLTPSAPPENDISEEEMVKIDFNEETPDSIAFEAENADQDDSEENLPPLESDDGADGHDAD